MTLAIFDLDYTLLAGDSDYLWGSFLCEESLVDTAEFSKKNDQFFSDYLEGSLDILAYQEFILRPLTRFSIARLEKLRLKFLEEKINPIILKKGKELIAKHVSLDHHPIIVTATNDFVTRPIADLLGITDLLACTAEFKDGRYTGKTIGVPTFKEGKVIRLNQWVELNNQSLRDAWFYTDSHNDLPLLKVIDNPVAVDPDQTLKETAEKQGWKIISLRP